MPLIQQILFYSVSAIILVLILVLVRKKKLREADSWLWLAFAFFLIIFISNITIIQKLSNYLQIAQSLVLVFLSLVAFLIFILKLFMIAASYQIKIKNLSQKIALLEEKIDRISSEKDKENKAG